MVDIKSIWNDKQLKSNEKLVLIYLASYHNEKYGYSFPKRDQIVEGTGISLKTLNKVLNSLEDKNYITKANNPKKGGRNNIYYINKYLVIKDTTQLEPITDDLNNEPTNISNDNIKSDTEPLNKSVEKSANENLLNDIGIQKLNSEQLEQLNKLDTDKLIKSIEIAKQNSNNINFNYLMAIYNNKKTYEEPHKNNKGKAVKGAKQQVFTGNTVKTKYHDTFNEHFKKYDYDELDNRLRARQQSARASILAEYQQLKAQSNLVSNL